MTDKQLSGFKNVLVEIFKDRYPYQHNKSTGFKRNNKYDMQVVSNDGEIIVPYIYDSRFERIENGYDECEIKINDEVEIDNVYEYLLDEENNYSIWVAHIYITGLKMCAKKESTFNKNNILNNNKVLMKNF